VLYSTSSCAKRKAGGDVSTDERDEGIDEAANYLACADYVLKKSVVSLPGYIRAAQLLKESGDDIPTFIDTLLAGLETPFDADSSPGTTIRRERCRSCGCRLQPQELAELTPWHDCGGDCVTCMARAGDPDCIAALEAWLALAKPPDERETQWIR
jgi:hypothetical protein